MSEVKKIATRMSYGNALVELGKEHDDLLVFEADLGGATKTTIFRDVFPDRHIECGIAEANMVGMAAGISTTGIVPLYHHLQCLQQVERLTNLETQLVILT